MSTTQKKPTAAIVTLGCKVNQYESEAIAEGLEAAGFCLRPQTEPCDLYVVNTCTVTSESDRKSRQLIRRLLCKNPNACMVVTGCSAQVRAEGIAAIAGVDAVVGNRDKMTVVDVAKRLWENGAKSAAPELHVPSLEGSGFEPMTITRFDRTRAYVKIQDGCESHCTYCTIPAARGPQRSKPIDDVIAEVEALVAGGCREVVLTGIETGAWGRDLGRMRLEDLLCEVDKIPHLGRVRLGSLDPTVMTHAFVERVAGLRTLAPHFHLSMQSGCSATLARMKRKYNADGAMAAMERVRAAMPQVQFTTDMIVGFPGESEAEFAESLAFAKKAQFLHIHVFPYSRREGTPAAIMKDQIPESVKHERVAALSAVSRESCAAILDRAVAAAQAGAEPLTALMESRDGGYIYGHTPDFMEVKLACNNDCDLGGCEIAVRPVARDGETMLVEWVRE